MAIPEAAKRAALRQVAAFCESRIPVEIRDRVRLEHSVRGAAITIRERRPPWQPEYGPEWSSTDVARLRYDAASALWSLQWKGSDGGWHLYEGIRPARDVAPLLEEIDTDPTGIFWG